jgi:NADH-quinone oxidoreductase subunit I
MIIPLLKGLWLTLKKSLSRPITVQYPEQKVPPAPRWRGVQYFEKKEDGRTRCVACGLCMAVCPSQCIYVESARDEEGKWYPARYEIDSTRCIFCGYCEEACPVKAVFMGSGYEWVDRNRRELYLDTERLLEQKKINPVER